MGIFNWLRGSTRKSKQPDEQVDKTLPLEHLSMLEMTQPPKNVEQEIYMYETEEKLKEAIRKKTKVSEWMIKGIRFSHSETRDGKFTYEIYKADSQATALQFLKSTPSGKIPALYYVIVETPSGNIGIDKEGIFDEKTGKEIN